MTQLQFRVPTNKELDSLNQLLSDPFYRYVRTANKQITDGISSNINREQLQEFRYIVYTMDGVFVGYIEGYYPVTNYNLWIQILITAKNKNRQGYGRQILSYTLKKLMLSGNINDIYLTCHNNNLIGFNFWRKMGFATYSPIKESHCLMTANLRSLTCIPNHLKP